MDPTKSSIHLTSMILEPEGSTKIDLEEGEEVLAYEKYLVFYPSLDGPGSGYLNIRFLDAELQGSSIIGRNTDVTFEHELWIMQFNHPLPPIFQIKPWQILIEGKLP